MVCLHIGLKFLISFFISPVEMQIKFDRGHLCVKLVDVEMSIGYWSCFEISYFTFRLVIGVEMSAENQTFLFQVFRIVGVISRSD